MSVYYFTILYFLVIGYIYDRYDKGVKQLVFILTVMLFTILFGFRYEVGVDWFNYIDMYHRQVANIFSFDSLEVGYKLLNVIAYYVGHGIVTVIFISTLLFITFTLLGVEKVGLNPYYFFATVAPYHFVMSGMNYTRQSIALSVFIYAIACFFNNEKIKYLVFILIAGMFHASALVFVPLFFLGLKKRYLCFVLFFLIPLIAIQMLMEYQQYLDTSMDNAGLFLRLFYLLIPTIVLITYYHTISMAYTVDELRVNYMVIVSFPVLILLSIISTTMADRFAYYFILLSTMTTFRLINIEMQSGVARFGRYIPLLMFFSSSVALVVWNIYSGYISEYRFNSYLFIWLE